MVSLACILLAFPTHSLDASHIHNLLLGLVHVALLVLVYDTHLVTCFANVVLAVGGVFHVGVQARTVSGHKS